jgi:hypothetical protein
LIFVTGTMRSGTSTWMRLLRAAGFPIVGEAFPAPWGEALRALNPRGFWESRFTSGVYWATNPHPLTGEYLFPEHCRDLVAKVFVSGLVKSDVAFVDRVLGTVRDVRSVAASIRRFREIEAAAGLPGPEAEAPELQWWVDTFALIRDLATRRHAAHVVSLGALVRDPEREITIALRWLGRGDAAAAISEMSETLPGQSLPRTEPPYPREWVETWDELYARIDAGRDLDASFVRRLNALDGEIRPLVAATWEGRRA